MMIPPGATWSPHPPPSTRYGDAAYTLRRRWWSLFGARVDILTPDGRPVLFCRQEAFRLREDIRLYADDSERVEMIAILARNIFDFSAAYDVWDVQAGERVGVLRRRGWESIMRDTWEILDTHEDPVARIVEDNLGLALVRRFLCNFIPQTFDFTSLAGQPLAQARQRFNPFIQTLDLTMPRGPQAQWLDPRLVLAASILLVVIEGRQEQDT